MDYLIMRFNYLYVKLTAMTRGGIGLSALVKRTLWARSAEHNMLRHSKRRSVGMGVEKSDGMLYICIWYARNRTTLDWSQLKV